MTEARLRMLLDRLQQNCLFDGLRQICRASRRHKHFLISLQGTGRQCNDRREVEDIVDEIQQVVAGAAKDLHNSATDERRVPKFAATVGMVAHVGN